MNPRRLLLIDDDRLQSRLVEQQLKAFRHERFQMEWQEIFEMGLERLLSGEHEVCLLDYKLGPRDGLELIRLAKEAGCEVPIIFLTAESSSDIDIEAMNAGIWSKARSLPRIWSDRCVTLSSWLIPWPSSNASRLVML
jgi:DNA-binding response OmpR family regulator